MCRCIAMAFAAPQASCAARAPCACCMRRAMCVACADRTVRGPMQPAPARAASVCATHGVLSVRAACAACASVARAMPAQRPYAQPTAPAPPAPPVHARYASLQSWWCELARASESRPGPERPGRSRAALALHSRRPRATSAPYSRHPPRRPRAAPAPF